MIKFFRNIRKDLLKQNKFTKYLFYAIGEIILVVIGILVALQINNWNNNKQRNKLEKELLNQVRFDILAVYKDLKMDLQRLRLGQRSHNRILDYFESNTKYADSMCFDFYWLIKDEYIFPKTTAFSRIQKEGIDIIRNDSIKDELLYLYESHFTRITTEKQFFPNIEEFFADYYQENFRPNIDFDLKFIEITPSGDTIQYPNTYNVDGVNRTSTIGFIPLDFEKLKKDSKFQVLVNRSKEYRWFKIRRYTLAEESIKKIIPMIDKELEFFEN